MWTARQSLTRVAPAPVHRLRHLSAGTKAPASPGAPAAPEFGQKHAGDDTSAGQLMHDISKGRFEYIGDFMASLNRGPVKLDFGKEAKPLSEKDRARDELNTRNLQLVQRSLVLGTVAAGVCCWLGWQVTKWNYGVRNMSEFGEVMRERMPKVSGKMEDSAVGRRLQQASEESRDAISESERLTDWRRTIRGKFNTEEGAAIARQNSIMLAERRQVEKALRKTRATDELGSVKGTAATAPPSVDGVAATTEAAEVAASATVAEEEAPPTLTRTISRALTRVLPTATAAVSTAPPTPTAAAVPTDSPAAAEEEAPPTLTRTISRALTRVLPSAASESPPPLPKE